MTGSYLSSQLKPDTLSANTTKAYIRVVTPGSTFANKNTESFIFGNQSRSTKIYERNRSYRLVAVTF